MDLGFSLPQCGNSVTPDGIRIVAQRCEELGYRTVWGLERILRPLNPQVGYANRPPASFAEQYRSVFDGLEILTWTAAFTTRVRLGMSVVVLPWHSPIDTARRVATLDILSGGRFDFGIGSGWSKDEYDAAGVPFERQSGRMYDYFKALEALWGPDPVEYHGEFYTIPASEIGPKPLQRPVPLYYATFNERGFRMLAKYCHGWNPQRMTPTRVREQADLLKSMVRDAGRDNVTFRTAYRVNMPIIADSEMGERLPFSGPFEQWNEDLAALNEAGVDEVHFETGFLPDVNGTDDYLRWAENLRALWP